MTGELAQARPSRFSALLPAAGNQDQIRPWCDAGSSFSTTADPTLGDLSHSAEPNTSDLDVMITQRLPDTS